jgi:alkyl hydroperoxide reductase subunit AhpC
MIATIGKKLYGVDRVVILFFHPFDFNTNVIKEVPDF